ncbi:hypothetical protein TRICI_005942 [Trichomonascus ciferrii]|uniref:Uncharacterized protein n=1 Tax=Trichomonascus ciferrii TaxID=44093 RepID=A0A642UMV0_9ASCO|nr:hypothetical protein TRICI_005942 [Trichomonascus ciferrii]
MGEVPEDRRPGKWRIPDDKHGSGGFVRGSGLGFEGNASGLMIADHCLIWQETNNVGMGGWIKEIEKEVGVQPLA